MNDSKKQEQTQEEKETAIVEVVEEPMSVTEKAEIDVQVATAHRYPRSVTRFQQSALAMATVNVETAASCFYCLKRKGKTGVKNIEGPSIRLAEIIGSSWGNMRYGARIVREEKEFIVAQGTAHDLERNVATTIEVKRRIVDKHKKKYSVDMIGVTAQAAQSIALRNAIFKVIPKTFVDMVYLAAKKAAVGDMKTLAKRRDDSIKYFDEQGVTKDRVLKALGRDGVDDINLKDLEMMIGWATAIKDNEVSADDIFPTVNIMPKRKSDKKNSKPKDEDPKEADFAPMSEEEKRAIEEAEAQEAAKEETEKQKELGL